MHEMGIAAAIVKTSMDSIPKGMERARVAAVNLKVGRLTAVVPESLRYCFDILCRDTPLAGAALNIREIPIVLHCLDCGSETTPGAATFACPTCGGRARLVSGRELTFESIELAGPDAPARADG